jgi:hypothetical protein
VIEAKLPVVLNSLTEHDIQDTFKKVAEVLEMVHMCGR